MKEIAQKINRVPPLCGFASGSSYPGSLPGVLQATGPHGRRPPGGRDAGEKKKYKSQVLPPSPSVRAVHRSSSPSSPGGTSEPPQGWPQLVGRLRLTGEGFPGIRALPSAPGRGQQPPRAKPRSAGDSGIDCPRRTRGPALQPRGCPAQGSLSTPNPALTPSRHTPEGKSSYTTETPRMRNFPN